VAPNLWYQARTDAVSYRSWWRDCGAAGCSWPRQVLLTANRLNSLVSGQQIQLTAPDERPAWLVSPLSFTQQMRKLLTRSPPLPPLGHLFTVRRRSPSVVIITYRCCCRCCSCWRHGRSPYARPAWCNYQRLASINIEWRCSHHLHRRRLRIYKF